MQQQFMYACSGNVTRVHRPYTQPLIAVKQAEQGVTTFASCIQVVQTDKTVFEAVQDKFVALTPYLLPKLVGALTVLQCDLRSQFALL